MFQLVAEDGRRYPLNQPTTTVGREGTDIVLVDPQISRQHAQFRLEGEQVIASDLASTNGTFVNGVRLQTPKVLQPGDVVRVGQSSFTLQGGMGAQKTQLAPGAESWEGAPLPDPQGYQPPPPQWAAEPAPQAPANYASPPSWEQDPYAGGAAGAGPVVNASRPPKDRSLAYLLEFLLLGLGWIYAGETGWGVTILVSWVVIGLGVSITLNVITGGLACFCTIPLAVVAYAISLTRLGAYIQSHPETFG